MSAFRGESVYHVGKLLCRECFHISITSLLSSEWTKEASVSWSNNWFTKTCCALFPLCVLNEALVPYRSPQRFKLLSIANMLPNQQSRQRTEGNSRIGLEWMKWFNVSDSASPLGNGTIWAPNWHQVNCFPLSNTHTHCFLFHTISVSAVSHTHITVSPVARPVHRWPVPDKQRPVLSDYNDGWPPASYFIGISQESLRSQAELQVNSLLWGVPKSHLMFTKSWKKGEMFHDFIRPESAIDRAAVNDSWMWLAGSGMFY